MKRVFELSINNREEVFTLPINPASFELVEDNLNQKITLLNIGEVNLLGNRGLVKCTISSFFPSTLSPFFRFADREPMEYIGVLKKWKNSKRPFRLIVSGSEINLAMAIEKLTFSQREGDGDVYYTLELAEYRLLNVPAIQVEEAVVLDDGLSDRPDTLEPPKTHRVVSGDCLWNLAKKHYGSGAEYTKIYEANKAIIGSNPNNIKVGQELVIP